MRLYSDLALWFHLLTHPSDYEDEAAFITRIIDATFDGSATTLLELGSGGGNNASHLKQRFSCTLTDLSPEMLELSRALNPECEHLQGDMLTLRLGSVFDAVLVHDAIAYITTEDDLRAALETVAVHLRPGGVAVLVPDTTRELFVPGTEHGGHDGDGRGLRYLEWDHDPDPDDTTYDVELVVVLMEDGKEIRVEHDHHTCGVFSDAVWRDLIAAARLELVDVETIHDPNAGEHAVFVARKSP
ncbi:MAG: class I SAM-dependent methyltransferase [Gaiellaceae bacterium]